MDDTLTPLVAQVRADTSGFSRDVEAMRTTLEGSLSAGADRAGRAIETALVRAVRTGKLGFDDLRSVALAALNEIAAGAIRSGIEAIPGGGRSSGGTGGGGIGGLVGLLTSIFAGATGRATGGPVSPNRPYWVGERGPELFVPTASGTVERAGGNARAVTVAITIDARGGGEAGTALARSSRQVARAVRAALNEE